MMLSCFLVDLLLIMEGLDPRNYTNQGNTKKHEEVRVS